MYIFLYLKTRDSNYYTMWLAVIFDYSIVIHTICMVVLRINPLMARTAIGQFDGITRVAMLR